MTTSSTAAPHEARSPRGRARPAHPAAIVQLVQRRTFSAGKPRVMLIRAEPVWEGPERLPLDRGRTVRIATAVSPLAVLEAVTGHRESQAGSDELLVVLTDAEEAELGSGLLARVYQNRVYPIEPWSVVRQLFGAREIDPRLTAEGWAAEALIDAAGQGDWPKVPGAMLSRDTALARLAVTRLSTSAHRLNVDSLDLHAFLAWSLAPGASERLAVLGGQERRGLTKWLTDPDRAGESAGALSALFALFDAGRGTDTAPMGLVCSALWGPDAPSSADRARGRAEQVFNATWLDDSAFAVFGTQTQSYVRALLLSRTAAVDSPDGADPYAVLDRAETLIRQFGAEEAAGSSTLLPSGLQARFGAVAQALTRCVPADASKPPSEPRIHALADAVRRLDDHVLTGWGSSRDSVVRIRMAQRLVQWLAQGEEACFATAAQAVNLHIGEYGWVDLATGHIHDGDSAHPELSSAYSALHAAVHARRHAVDEAFAARLADEVASDSEPAEALVVESFARRVLAPVVKASRNGAHPLLFLLLDGASAAIAADLAEQLRARAWVEHDPVIDVPGPPHRRAMTSALPSLTTVSRGSLFAGELVELGQGEERSRFVGHQFWNGAAVRLFHKAGLRGEAGTPLGTELTEALADPGTHVAVVVNTIDDRLREDRPVSNWQLDELLGVAELLASARINGRAVVITSDHGHIIDRESAKVAAPDALSARHRTGSTPTKAGEVALAGRRVVAPGQRIVALWDSTARYGNRQAGYHGGAALAEVAIPVLAFVPRGATAPKGWRELGPQRPQWWSLEADGYVTALAERRPSVKATPAKRRASAAVLRRQAEQLEAAEIASGQGALVPVTAVESPPSPASESSVASRTDQLIESLRSSDILQAQLNALPRKEDFASIGAAVRALVEAHGILPVSAVAEEAGKRPARAAGFAATLQRVLNYDQVEVLTLVDSGRSLRLDLEQLRQQFGLRDTPGTPK
ncbi:BREX-2 system phosphatase PglZ [Streptomyces sp. ISL-100]|uniref:BREX-2 system phosphatase PglZ n=1 Tax=Streptomyces sp. ISL-100 TaxID=2819173 RepID=UPI001BEAF7DA|nr:BREX-2 system phosphatase PglZ [Streptomyces sp. ISL-100]MBT2396440.1 BREX-2 system phosphatase PglZ [Streptomyces sp. ISL-100]